MIEAVIFDMDGVLIDSEPFWQKAEKEFFKNLGIDITPEMARENYGMPTTELIEHYYKTNPWENFDSKKIKYEIFDKVEEMIVKNGSAMEGVNYILNFFKKRNIKIALASASPEGIIETALNVIKIKNEFDVIHSGTAEEYGKPHPAVFINTAKKLDVKPVNCLVFEDSVFGLIAAKAARMKAISIPDKSIKNDPRLSLADFKLNSLLEFTEKHVELLNSLN